jgi:hypothetical protein
MVFVRYFLRVVFVIVAITYIIGLFPLFYYKSLKIDIKNDVLYKEFSSEFEGWCVIIFVSLVLCCFNTAMWWATIVKINELIS